MSTKLIYLISLVVVLGLVLPSAANAADPDLIGWWKFDEMFGTTARDSSGNDRDGTFDGDPQWVQGWIGGALEFDGQGDHVIDDDGEVYLNGLSALTVAMWIKSDVINTDRGFIIAVPPAGQDRYITMRYDSAGSAFGGDDVFKMGVNTNLSGNADGQQLESSAKLQTTEWQHVVMTWESAGLIRFYVNGMEDTPTGRSNANQGGIIAGCTTLIIGAGGKDDNFAGAGWDGLIDDVRIYGRVLAQEEIQQVMKGIPPSLASNPIPPDDATDIPREVVLGWTPGEFANTHDVYFGSIFTDVNDAGRTNQRGVLASQGQIATSYDPPGHLDFGQTYFWRVDEVNAPPSSTIFKGAMWSFTAEPIAYPIDASNIAATASSSNSAAEGPENTINGSGLNAGDLHSATNTDMWLSSLTGQQPTWIQYEFDKVYKLHQMWVWNHNTLIEAAIGLGIKEATIEYSTDGATWTPLDTTHEFARAPGAAGYASNTTVDFGGVAAKYVRITANGNWGGILAQYGLSEVRFFSIPVLAREASPAPGATDVSVDTTLRWKAGREAAQHTVYLSIDQQAVIDGTAPAVTVSTPGYAASLDLAGTYYWRVDEVNEAETPSTWQGDVWSLSTQEYLVVDDFESYNDIETGKEGSNLVYETWVDGFGTTTNGSVIGYSEAFQPSMEKTRSYDGKQSVPLFYNNTAATRSEVTANVANLQAGQNWTMYGIKGLTLRFYGDPNNVPQQMYAKVNSAKVTYDGSADNLKEASWQMWYIDLASLGTNLSNVTTLTIGFERIGTTGGQGMVLLDGIRLGAAPTMVPIAVPDAGFDDHTLTQGGYVYLSDAAYTGPERQQQDIRR